jgi:predicted transcriptional regulator
MKSLSVKEEARRLIERLPDSATWDDLEYEIYVRRAIESGLADSEAGNVQSTSEVRIDILAVIHAARSLPDDPSHQ